MSLHDPGSHHLPDEDEVVAPSLFKSHEHPTFPPGLVERSLDRLRATWNWHNVVLNCLLRGVVARFEN